MPSARFESARSGLIRETRHAGYAAPISPDATDPTPASTSIPYGTLSPVGNCSLNTVTITNANSTPSGTPSTAPVPPTNSPVSSWLCASCALVPPMHRMIASPRCCSAIPVVSPVMMMNAADIVASTDARMNPMLLDARFFSSPLVTFSVVVSESVSSRSPRRRSATASGSYSLSLRCTSTSSTTPARPVTV
jgi:hypothetical protein